MRADGIGDFPPFAAYLATLSMAVNVEAKPWIHELPAYSPVTETPDYTAEPRPDEERIQINRRLIREESGVFVTQNKQITVALTNQSVDCTEPTYGRGATVQGMVTLAKTEGVISVIVKVCTSNQYNLCWYPIRVFYIAFRRNGVCLSFIDRQRQYRDTYYGRSCSSLSKD